MKKLSIYLFLILFSFQTSSLADDIRYFQIEGMSIGDSLLDYFSKKEINANIQKYYDSDKYTIIEFYSLPKFEVYSGVSFATKKLDENFIIKQISGVKFIKNINNCYDEKNKIDKELSKMFSNTTREVENEKHEADETGKSTTRAIRYYFESGDLVTVICYDWSDDITEKFKWGDNLSVEITTKEFNDFLLYEASE